MRILRSISFAIASSLYGLIPNAYDLFIRIASTEFFTEDAIQEISNNIYILVSVCMLFAFGIKLISTIVNPDLFDDKKKGPAKTFVNSIIAVLLITITPMAFKYMYELQTSIVKNKIIEKVAFGMDPDSDVKAGNILAAYTFRAFCYPKITSIDSETGEITSEVGSASARNYYKVLQGDMSALDQFGDDINSKTDGEWDYEYHILLAPISAGYVAYEMILMTIDVAFRSIKLGLLQFIAPLVIIGFIFSGTDLLVRWLKEIVATFVLLFAKMGAIIFIIFGLSKFDEFIKGLSTDKDGFWITGLLRIIFLIALLQLIKKIPDILNKIFGTDIKLNGGLGDRLAEMAGVGAVAKTAWDKVKPLAGKALAGAGITASGLLPAAAAVGAGAGIFARGWKNGLGNHKPIKDTKGGRAIRTLGAYGKGIGAGVTAKGGVVKSISEGAKAFGETEMGKQIQTQRLQAQQDRKSQMFRDKVNSTARALGAKGDVIKVDKDTGTITYEDSLIAQKAMRQVLLNDSSLNFSKAQRENMAKLYTQKGILGTLDELKGQKEKFINEITNSQNSLNKSDPLYQAKYDQLEALKGNIVNGGKTHQQIDAEIQSLFNSKVITEFAANNMGTSLNKIVNAINSSDLTQSTKDAFLNTAKGLDLSNKNLLSVTTDTNNTIAGMQADYDQAKEGATADAKELLGRYESSYNNINAKAVFEQQRGACHYAYGSAANQGGGNQGGGNQGGGNQGGGNQGGGNQGGGNQGGGNQGGGNQGGGNQGGGNQGGGNQGGVSGYTQTASGIYIPTGTAPSQPSAPSQPQTQTIAQSQPDNITLNQVINNNTNVQQTVQQDVKQTVQQDNSDIKSEIERLQDRVRELTKNGVRLTDDEKEELADIQDFLIRKNMKNKNDDDE